MGDQVVIQAAAIEHRFRSGDEEIVVLDGVSLTLRAGESCAILGPSGSGKTTLLTILAGLVTPTSGRVTLLDHDLTQMTDDQIATLRGQRCGFVFQNYQILPALTAVENVMVPLDIQGKSDRATAVAILERVGLGHRLHHYPSQLSGGEQQRVALARAFVHRPSVIFADEPTGSLDRASAQVVLEILFELNRDYGAAVVLVTHDVELGARLNRTLTLRNGKVVDG